MERTAATSPELGQPKTAAVTATILISTNHPTYTSVDQWFCEVCTGDVGDDELWRAAVIVLMGNDGF